MHNPNCGARDESEPRYLAGGGVMAAMLADGVAGASYDEVDGVIGGPFYVRVSVPIAGAKVEVLSKTTAGVTNWRTDPNFAAIFGNATEWTCVATGLEVLLPTQGVGAADIDAILLAQLEHDTSGTQKPRYWPCYDRTAILASLSATDATATPGFTWQTQFAHRQRLNMPRNINVNTDTLYYIGQPTTAGYDAIIKIDGLALRNDALATVPGQLLAGGAWLQSVARAFSSESGGWGVAGSMLANIRSRIQALKGA